PFQKLRHQGMVLSYSYQDALGAYHSYDEIDFTGQAPALKATGEALKEQVEKMSKSKKNVVSPDEIIERYGADTMRLYEMFMGDFEQPKPWDMRTIEGVSRFLQRVWRLQDMVQRGAPEDANLKLRHQTIQAVTERVENFKFNTAIAALMEYAKALTSSAFPQADLETLALLISPFAPHLAEEIWERTGHSHSIFKQPWPKADPSLLREEVMEYPVQVNGKLRDRLSIAVDAGKDEVISAAKSLPKVREFLKGQDVVKEILIPGKMVSFVTRNKIL
ncbi:MAG: class I tRNA ligase family protein, partial [Elusimicrobia bacterium]|nr:class I tRNA ligase family protein [Elusimicrobiota bacterium]